MGIKGFSAWLRSTFPHVFCPIPTVPGSCKLQVLHFDQVYIDLNPFLHLGARQSNGIDDLVKSCRKNLRMAVQNLTKANSMVYISIDGPAPLAKLPEQRARRQDAAVTAAKRSTFDAQQITPGCMAMTTIESQVYTLLRELFFTSGKVGAFQSADFSAILDGTGVEGEGEFKIIRKVLHDHIDGDALKGRVTRAILACDADLFLQALLSDVPHLYLFDPFAPYQSQTTIFSVDRWRRALAAESFGGDDSRTTTCGRRVAFDFVLFALMSGSDYAPAIKYANYRSLWPCYLEFIQKRSSEGKKPRLSVEPTSTIVDAERKSIDLKVLRDFFGFYVREGLAETLQEPLKIFHDELDAAGKNERILNYAELMIWNLDALATCNVPDLSISMESEKTAPSLLELADFDAESLQEILNERLRSPTKSSDDQEEEVKCKYPGVMALMALDRSTECQEFLAEPLKPLMLELKDETSELGMIRDDDSKLVRALTERIDALPKESFSIIEKLATFPRAPIVLTKKSASDEPNFFTIAMKPLLPQDISEMRNLPWMRPYVYAVNEEESWRCPLHRMLFNKYRNK